MRPALALAVAALAILLAPSASACFGMPAPHHISVLDMKTGRHHILPVVPLGGLCGFDPPDFDMDATRIVWLEWNGTARVHDIASNTTHAVLRSRPPGALDLPTLNGPRSGRADLDISLAGDHIYILGWPGTLSRMSLSDGTATGIAWPFAGVNGTFRLAGNILWAAELGADGSYEYLHAYDLDAGQTLLPRTPVTASNGASTYDAWYPSVFLRSGVLIIPPNVYAPAHTFLELVDGRLQAHPFVSPHISNGVDATSHLYGRRADLGLARWSLPPTRADEVRVPAEAGMAGQLLAAYGDVIVLFMWDARAVDAADAEPSPSLGPSPTTTPGKGAPAPAWLLVGVVALLAAAVRRRR